MNVTKGKEDIDIDLDQQMKKSKEDIGLHILILRRELSLKQYKLAEAMKISTQTLSLIENGKKKLSYDLALRLYFVLDRTVEEYKDSNLDAVDTIIDFKTDILLPYIAVLSNSISL